MFYSVLIKAIPTPINVLGNPPAKNVRGGGFQFLVKFGG
jgi:hypothetical protein